MVIQPQLNRELFFYLTRHHKVIFTPENLYDSNSPSLVIEDDRTFKIEGNKKYLKMKLFEFVENRNPELVEGDQNIADTNRTIKYFIEQSSKIKKS
jgi:hypothetical protein